ncbi:hypothetical protein [Sorangium sp. So ce1389]|uniref:hypothetical protein n=1 Tax=Sorangium sp. So ce1389 TaxID=3133336 RepID=UPI003F616326
MESYVKALTSFVLDTSTLLHLDNAAIQRTVFIDNANIPTTDFEIAPAQMDMLIENGAAATRRWFEAHPLANFYRPAGPAGPTLPARPRLTRPNRPAGPTQVDPAKAPRRRPDPG